MILEITNVIAKRTTTVAKITNAISEITNDFAEITNAIAEITNVVVEITNDFAKTTNAIADIPTTITQSTTVTVCVTEGKAIALLMLRELLTSLMKIDRPSLVFLGFHLIEPFSQKCPNFAS